jgi:HSP20 family protein
MHERRQASYYRSVTLPTPVDSNKATAKFEHGELIVTLPKAEEAKPKQIRIGNLGTQGQPQRTIEAGNQPRTAHEGQVH